MRPLLLWSLGLSVATSVGLICHDERGLSEPKGNQLHDGGPRSEALSSPLGSVAIAQQAANHVGNVEPSSIDPAKADPFYPTPRSLPASSSAGRVIESVASLPVALPVAPQPSWRYWGSMETPEGKRIVMLARKDGGGKIEPVDAGSDLDDGYRVEAVTGAMVKLVYPALGTVVELPITNTSD